MNTHNVPAKNPYLMSDDLTTRSPWLQSISDSFNGRTLSEYYDVPSTQFVYTIASGLPCTERNCLKQHRIYISLSDFIHGRLLRNYSKLACDSNRVPWHPVIPETANEDVLLVSMTLGWLLVKHYNGPSIYGSLFQELIEYKCSVYREYWVQNLWW